MGEYEIRITDGKRHTILAVVHLSDHAAIRHAKKLAEGKPYEVWRGMDCVYGASNSYNELQRASSTQV